jgi:alpha-galactosidase
MPIKVENNTISIETKNTLYQMKADDFGVLKHLWYGEKTNTDMEYLLSYPDVGFSGNPYDAGNDRTYSLDTMPQEYPTYGTGDFRITAMSVINPDGSEAVDLRYEGHKIYKGKYSIPGLPAVYADDDDAQTLEVFLKDKNTDIQVTLCYGVIEKWDIITRSAIIKNGKKDSVKIKNAASVCVDIPHGEWEWVHFYGRHTAERLFERSPIIHGIQESSSNRGTSSHHQNPSVLLCSKECNEDFGSCIGAALLYSGSFKTKIECDQLNQTRMVMGINNEHFEWTLNSGEVFYTPEVILSYSSHGFSKLSNNFHNIIRNNVCRGNYKLSKRPILINNWEATYFGFNADKLYDIAKTASELGIDMFVMDDGWFGKRDDDLSGLGDWTVNEKKLGTSLCDLTKRITSLGMKFGIWMEPEMVSEDSDLYRNHPDWAIKIPQRDPVRSRYQLVLDMSRSDVIDYLYNSISKILKSADISYVKWDMNRSICDWYSNDLPISRFGELQYRYVLGLYELLERLVTDFPNVLIEGCSGGGGRFDAGMLYYCPQIWCSDDTDAYERTKIQYGTSFFYPISTMGSHVSAVPNHQTGKITSIKMRGYVAMSGSFGYELDLNKLSDEEKEEVKNQVEHFKENQDLIHNGEYYRLSNPMTDKFAVWEYVKDGNALVHGMIFKTEPNMKRYSIKLKGLDENENYSVNGKGCISGAALMTGGVLLDAPWGDYFPVELYINKL